MKNPEINSTLQQLEAAKEKIGVSLKGEIPPLGIPQWEIAVKGDTLTKMAIRAYEEAGYSNNRAKWAGFALCIGLIEAAGDDTVQPGDKLVINELGAIWTRKNPENNKEKSNIWEPITVQFDRKGKVIQKSRAEMYRTTNENLKRIATVIKPPERGADKIFSLEKFDGFIQDDNQLKGILNATMVMTTEPSPEDRSKYPRYKLRTLFRGSEEIGTLGVNPTGHVILIAPEDAGSKLIYSANSPTIDAVKKGIRLASEVPQTNKEEIGWSIK